jgi:hypothetical protein
LEAAAGLLSEPSPTSGDEPLIAVGEAINGAVNVYETTPDIEPEEHTESAHSVGKIFSLDNVIVFIACECFAVPLNIAAGEAFVAAHYDRAGVGWGIGVPLAVAGFTFHWWKNKTPAFRDWTYRQARRWWYVPFAAAFIYVTGPEMYRRATVAPPSMREFTQEQVDAKIASATGPLNEKIASLQHQLYDAKKTSAPTLPSQPPSTEPPQTATYGSLHSWQIKILVDALTGLKPRIPVPPSIVVARPQMVEPQIFSRQFENAIMRAGVTPIVSQQNPGSSDQTGVMIGVPDVTNPSEIALEMQKVVRQMGFDGRFVALPSAIFLPDKKSGEFAIFIAPPAL